MEKTKKIFKIISIISFILCALCPIFYNIIGSSIDENGFLNEPFYLVILGYLFFLIFIVSLTIFLILKKKSKN